MSSYKNKSNIDLLVTSAKDDVVAITLEGRYKIYGIHKSSIQNTIKWYRI